MPKSPVPAVIPLVTSNASVPEPVTETFSPVRVPVKAGREAPLPLVSANGIKTSVSPSHRPKQTHLENALSKNATKMRFPTTKGSIGE